MHVHAPGFAQEVPSSLKPEGQEDRHTEPTPSKPALQLCAQAQGAGGDNGEHVEQEHLTLFQDHRQQHLMSDHSLKWLLPLPTCTPRAARLRHRFSDDVDGLYCLEWTCKQVHGLSQLLASVPRVAEQVTDVRAVRWAAVKHVA